jgi:hypothetical protein
VLRRPRSRELYEVHDAEEFLADRPAPDADGTAAPNADAPALAARRPWARVAALSALVLAVMASAVALRHGDQPAGGASSSGASRAAIAPRGPRAGGSAPRPSRARLPVVRAPHVRRGPSRNRRARQGRRRVRSRHPPSHARRARPVAPRATRASSPPPTARPPGRIVRPRRSPPIAPPPQSAPQPLRRTAPPAAAAHRPRRTAAGGSEFGFER